MEVGENGEEKCVAGCLERDLISWSHPTSHSYLQNCHYGLQNYKNATTGLKCWPIHSDDVEMMWQ